MVLTRFAEVRQEASVLHLIDDLCRPSDGFEEEGEVLI